MNISKVQIQAQILTPSASLFKECSKSMAFAGAHFSSNSKKSLSCSEYLQRNVNECLWKEKIGSLFAIKEGYLGSDEQKQREVVEHICLLKAKDDLSDEQESNMLDHLYTTQYQMRGIIAISLGRISDQNCEQYTHAIFMRFQTKEDLAKFYANPFYLGILNEHVMPYCHGFINFDYESKVEDDILPIFRKGEEYNYGVELMLLLAFDMRSLVWPAEDAMNSLLNLTLEFPSLIVQATQGANINKNTMEYTHGVVIRFRSSEAFKIFTRSSEYETMWESKFQPIVKKALSAHFSVDPIAKELM